MSMDRQKGKLVYLFIKALTELLHSQFKVTCQHTRSVGETRMSVSGRMPVQFLFAPIFFPHKFIQFTEKFEFTSNISLQEYNFEKKEKSFELQQYHRKYYI